MHNKQEKKGAVTSSRHKRSNRFGAPLRFLLRFFSWLLVLGLSYAYLGVRCRPAMGFITGTTASLSGLLVGIFKGIVATHGNVIDYNGFMVAVIDECSGTLEMLIYAAAVLSVRVSWTKRLLGLVLGFLAIGVLNVIRIAAIVVAGSRSEAWFNFLHLYCWQGTVIVLVAALWWSWLKLAVHHG